MRRVLVASLLATLLIGCATQSPVQSYRPANYSGTPWQISGGYNELSGAVTILINGQKVVEGRMPLLGGTSELKGQFDNRPVTASCSFIVRVTGSRPQCLVFIANERAATLQF